MWEGIYQLLLADQVLLDILGPVTARNMRILRSFPQLQQGLTAYEPANEGWLVIDEPEPTLRAVAEQLESAWEIIEPTFAVLATRLSVCDDVSDRIDQVFHWTIDQQRALQFGERIVLFTRRLRTKDSWNKELKLYQKDIIYLMKMVVEEQIA